MRGPWGRAALPASCFFDTGDASGAEGGGGGATPLDLSLYDFDLPRERIALHPAARRDESRLLHLARRGRVLGHHVFRDLARLLRSRDLLVLNDTRVIPARLRGRKVPGGGRVEIFLLAPEKPGTWEVLWRPHRRVRPGTRAEIEGGVTGASLSVEVVGVTRTGHTLARFETPPGKDLTEMLWELGDTPLPPYIKRATVPADRERYQTVFARVPGSVAAPTAGLHFTEELLDGLEERGVGRATVTLHVGLPTFKPLTERELRGGELGEERYEVPAETAERIEETRARGGRVVAVGTTVVRALESAKSEGEPQGRGAAGSPDPARARAGAGTGGEEESGGRASSGRMRPSRGVTRCFIRPPYRFGVVDVLITNFHLPRSSLLLLTAAFAGRDALLAAYREAITRGYRFYSYGDAMIIE